MYDTILRSTYLRNTPLNYGLSVESFDESTWGVITTYTLLESSFQLFKFKINHSTHYDVQTYASRTTPI